jgi:multiple sugar transport system permease protein
VDGAGSFTVMIRITIPLLRRFIQFTFIVTLITAFTALFSLIFVMTGGGPGYGTTTLEFFIYEQGFSTGDFGLASTAGVTLFVAVAVVGLLQVRLLRTED